jgi:hypothetical protein
MLRFLLLNLLFAAMNLNAQPVPTSGHSSMQTYSFRLRPGQDLKTELDKLVKQYRIEAGILLTCVGSLTDVVLRLANQENGTNWHGHFEIVSLVGTLSINGSHLHLAVSDSTGQTYGGHLLDGCKIYTTVELAIGILPDLVYAREPDPTFGYKELVVCKRNKSAKSKR